MRRDVTKITDDHPEMDWDDAYAIQDEIRRRKEARGKKNGGPQVRPDVVREDEADGRRDAGIRLRQRLHGVHDGGEIKTSELIHPKVEAEICVVTKSPLKGPGCHVAAVMAAIDFVVPAVEVIDSRYRDFKFDLKSVIADNTSSSRFVIGGRMRDLGDLDLRTLGVVLEKNGEVVTMAAGAAVLGHPLAPWSCSRTTSARAGRRSPRAPSS